MSFNIQYKKPRLVFLASLISGPICWLVLRFALPVQTSNPLSANTMVFVGVCYIALAAGFFVFYNYNIKPNFMLPQEKTFLILTLIVVLSFLARYIDLFYLRGMSFDTPPKLNRIKATEITSLLDFIMAMASVLKSLYFFPFVIYYSAKSKLPRFLGIVSIVLLIFPFVEGFLLGNRKPFFEAIIISTLTMGYYFRPTLKQACILLTSIVMVGFMTLYVFIKREFVNTKPNYETILSAKYNYFVQPSENIKGFLQDETNNNAIRLVTFSMLHAGQYYVHGLYEFDSIYNQKGIPQTYGGYTFSSFFKALGKEPANPSPRGNVYVTAFGGFYFDFRWFAPLAFFLFGSVQGIFFSLSKSALWIRPLVVYFVMINFFLISINYIRGAGIYPLLPAVCLLIVLILFNRK